VYFRVIARLNITVLRLLSTVAVWGNSGGEWGRVVAGPVSHRMSHREITSL
jgi:hypothetical protein